MNERLKEVLEERINQRDLYNIHELQKALFDLGYPIPINDLYLAMKSTGWIKIWLIRDRIINLKRKIPKHYPYDGIRNLIKFPLLVPRNSDLPNWKGDKP